MACFSGGSSRRFELTDAARRLRPSLRVADALKDEPPSDVSPPSMRSDTLTATATAGVQASNVAILTGVGMLA